MGWVSILYFFVWLLAILLILLLLILIVPINLEIKSVEGRYEVKIKIWFLDLEKFSHMIPKREEKEDEVKKTEKKKRGGYKQIIKYSKRVLANAGKLLRAVIRSIKFKRLNLRLCVGGEDPSKVAVEYGKICSVFYPLAKIFVDINKPNEYSFSVRPDFLSSNIRADVDVHLRTRLFNILIIGINFLKVIMISSK